MAHKHKNRKSKVAHTKDHARSKMAKRHKASSWLETEGYVSSGRKRTTKRGGRGCSC